MTCSPYAVTSVLNVSCPECLARAGEQCRRYSQTGEFRKHSKRSHPARRRLADEQRTREVNPEVMR